MTWLSGTEIDRTSRWVRNIALAGRDSRNGYQYSREALTEAVELYEHKPVFLDHAERLASLLANPAALATMLPDRRL